MLIRSINHSHTHKLMAQHPRQFLVQRLAQRHVNMLTSGSAIEPGATARGIEKLNVIKGITCKLIEIAKNEMLVGDPCILSFEAFCYVDQASMFCILF